MAENSFSSRWSDEHSIRDEKWILVCAINATLEDDLGNYGLTVERGGRYRRAEFHMVDLTKNEIHRYCFPSLVHFVSMDSCVILDDSIYIFGDRPSHILAPPFDFDKLESQCPKTNQKIFFEASRLKLDQFLHTGWCPTPIPSESTASSPKCTSLMGKIYTFGSLYLNPEVFDPVDGNWKSICSLPEELVGSTLSLYPLPYPSKKRYFVHLDGGKLSSPSLYEFLPPGIHPDDDDDVNGIGTWNLIAPDFQGWTHIAVVFDDVIYFHSRKFGSVIRAFDVVSRSWLKVFWDSCLNDNLDWNNKRMEFDALFSLANGILCLAAWSPVYGSDRKCSHVNIKFYKFNVERAGKRIVVLSPLAPYAYDLLATCEVEAFLPV